MSFSLPGIHCEYSFMLLSMKVMAWALETSRLRRNCISLSSVLQKFDFCFQPCDTMLSVMDKVHANGGRFDSSRSIMGPISQAILSRKLSVARIWRCG